MYVEVTSPAVGAVEVKIDGTPVNLTGVTYSLSGNQNQMTMTFARNGFQLSIPFVDYEARVLVPESKESFVEHFFAADPPT